MITSKLVMIWDTSPSQTVKFAGHLQHETTLRSDIYQISAQPVLTKHNLCIISHYLNQDNGIQRIFRATNAAF